MQQIVLAQRPVGEPASADFGIIDVETRALRDGEVRVAPSYFSVDPYLRGRMSDAKSYVPPFAVGGPIASGAVGRVIESQSPGLAVGDRVTGVMDWSEEPVVDARGLTKVPDESSVSESWYLGVLGMPGLTAYVGLTEIGGMSGGEEIFISGAAGAVGSIAGQIAKARGAKVFGSAGSAEKVAQLRRLGFDDAFCYREESPRRALARMAPSGINLYFDNVGGAHLEAALDSLVDFGVVISCGAISLYNATEAVAGPRNFESSVVKKRLRIQGFIVTDHMKSYPRFVEEVAPLIESGKLQVLETIREGFASLPEAFLGLFHGDNLGKMIVRV